MKRIALLLGLAACTTATEPDVCLGGEVSDGVRVIELVLEAEAGKLPAQLRLPADASMATLPVVTQVFGGWDDALEPQSARLGPGRSVSLRVALAGPEWGEGVSDTRGPLARQALAAALRFASGDAEDAAGCTLSRRAPPADVNVQLLLGLSNGGNLVYTTLADADLELGALDGVITWETPIGAQLVNIEHRNSADLYAPGTCDLDTGTLRCPFLLESLVVADGALCFDLDADGACAADEVVRTEAIDPLTGRFATSAELLALARVAGTLPADWDDEAESGAFWAARDAALAVPAVVARYPDVAHLLVGSETDHVLTGLADHPHVYALGQRLQEAGAGWVRLNPGAAWTGLADENAVDAPLRVGTADGWLLSEDDEAPLEHILDAAVAELTDHARARAERTSR